MKMTLAWDDTHKLDGLSALDKKHYANFLFKVKSLGDSCIVLDWREPRSGPFHRRHFAMLKSVFEAQDVFDDPEMFRKWGEISAGFAKFVPMQSGTMCAMPDSIAYDRLDQQEFQAIHDKVFEFLRSEHARHYMWPHMSDGVSMNMVDAILREFSQ